MPGKTPGGPPRYRGLLRGAMRLRAPWGVPRGPPWTDRQVADTTHGIRRAVAAHQTSSNAFTGESYVYSLLANQHQHAKISAEYKPLPYGFV